MTDTADRARHARDASPFLTSKQTAFYLGISLATLKSLRAKRAGPRARKHGRTLRYHIDDIDAWSQAQAAEARHG
ncbi:helix-turn-helix transcriptional regulator [Sphingomonas sp. DT-204]|uniref:helix-turn-helix transcriptional regulator n=1 Tax=Sphingomonas sp. DT-204 TaxID=3396166 RepID=UPI003F1D3CEE